MPRPLRVEYEGARYHVMARGNRGSTVFGSSDDVRMWLKTLADAVKRADWRVHAYVLMRTHYHLLLETPQGNLVEGMKWFQGAFTQRMNLMRQAYGHLFQGRYKAKVIDSKDPSYFQKVSEYIHLNPAAAGLLGRREPAPLRSYSWSSYNFYTSTQHRPAWLTTASVLGSYGLKDNRTGRAVYRDRMESRSFWAATEHREFNAKSQFGGMDRGWVHGSDRFRDAMKEMLSKESGQAVYDKEQRRDLSEHGAMRVIEQGLMFLGVSMDQLPGMRKGAPEKLMMAAYIKEYFSLTNSHISRLLHMGHASLVGRVHFEMSRKEGLMDRYRDLKEKLDEEKTVQISG